MTQSGSFHGLGVIADNLINFGRIEEAVEP
jgi:hypothetical protein